MGKFSKIKKYSKPSHKINEKIENLDKQIKKILGEGITNSTSGVYTSTLYTEPVPAVPPTLSDVPDTSGITGSGFVQNDDTGDNTGYNDITQLFNNDIGENPTPIIQTPSETPAGGVGLVWHSYTLNGEAIGYIEAGNKFKQVLNPSISGGSELDPESPSYFGGNYYTKMALRRSFSAAYISAPHRAYNMTAGTYITLKCWLPYNPYGFGALYNDYTGIKKTDADGNWGLANVIVGITPNKYTSDPGSPYQDGYTTVLSRNALGDPNYYPGPISSKIGDKWGLSPEAYNKLKDIASHDKPFSKYPPAGGSDNWPGLPPNKLDLLHPSKDPQIEIPPTPFGLPQNWQARGNGSLIAGLGPEEVNYAIYGIKGLPPGHPDRDRLIDVLDRWAKPGSSNREKLIKIGIPLPGV